MTVGAITQEPPEAGVAGEPSIVTFEALVVVQLTVECPLLVKVQVGALTTGGVTVTVV